MLGHASVGVLEAAVSLQSVSVPVLGQVALVGIVGEMVAEGEPFGVLVVCRVTAVDDIGLRRARCGLVGVVEPANVGFCLPVRGGLLPVVRYIGLVDTSVRVGVEGVEAVDLPFQHGA